MKSVTHVLRQAIAFFYGPRRWFDFSKRGQPEGNTKDGQLKYYLAEWGSYAEGLLRQAIHLNRTSHLELPDEKEMLLDGEIWDQTDEAFHKVRIIFVAVEGADCGSQMAFFAWRHFQELLDAWKKTWPSVISLDKLKTQEGKALADDRLSAMLSQKDSPWRTLIGLAEVRVDSELLPYDQILFPEGNRFNAVLITVVILMRLTCRLL